MEERKKVSVDDWIARRQHVRHIAGYRERKEVILQWVPVVMVVRDHGGDGDLRRGLNHERETKKNEMAQGCHPLAQAVLLASPDPLAEETKGTPGWQTCLADDATGLRGYVRPAYHETYGSRARR